MSGRARGPRAASERSPASCLLFLLADRAFYGSNRLELLLGIFQFKAQAPVLRFYFGDSLTRGPGLGAGRTRRRFTQVLRFGIDEIQPFHVIEIDRSERYFSCCQEFTLRQDTQ